MLIGQAIINGQSVTLSPPNTNVLLMVVTATIAKLDPGFEYLDILVSVTLLFSFCL